MDFHAWFEAYLGGRWYTFDARHNEPRIGRVKIAHGRDAVDVALSTAYGAAELKSMVVWADEITEQGERPAASRPYPADTLLVSAGVPTGSILADDDEHRRQRCIGAGSGLSEAEDADVRGRRGAARTGARLALSGVAEGSARRLQRPAAVRLRVHRAGLRAAPAADHGAARDPRRPASPGASVQRQRRRIAHAELAGGCLRQSDLSDALAARGIATALRDPLSRRADLGRHGAAGAGVGACLGRRRLPRPDGVDGSGRQPARGSRGSRSWNEEPGRPGGARPRLGGARDQLTRSA